MRPLLTFLFLVTSAFTKAQLPKIENNQLVLDNPVTFKAGSNEITDEGQASLQQVKDFLVAKTYITLMRVEGHSDNTGAEADRQKLTGERALAVCRWLVSKGIDCKRLIAVGFGSNKPIEDNSTPEGKAKNRRMVFALAALRDRPIGGMPADGGGVVVGDICKEE